VTEKIKTTD